MKEERIKPVHPGEILFEEFLKPMGISQNKLALDIRVPPRRINEIVLGKRRISADTALRLGRYFGVSPQFWLGLQMDYDLDLEEDRLGDRLQHDVRRVCCFWLVKKSELRLVIAPQVSLFAKSGIPSAKGFHGRRSAFLQRKR